jgi:Ca2+-dependent lipid-binding protein
MWQPLLFERVSVRMTIVEVKGFPKMDLVGLSDPYCIVTLLSGPLSFTTSVKSNTLEPKWNETGQFLLTNPIVDVVLIRLFDKDLSRDNPMGSVRIDFNHDMNKQINDAWHEIKSEKVGKQGGQIHLILQIFPTP